MKIKESNSSKKNELPTIPESKLISGCLKHFDSNSHYYIISLNVTNVSMVKENIKKNN
jgi:hypothetical protein